MRHIQTGWFVLLLSAILAFGCVPAFCQSTTTGAVTGTVVDSSGAVVPNASVILNSKDTGDSRTVTSNDSGAYRFPQLKPGNYQIEASTPGLRSNRGSIIVSLGQSQNVNLTVSPQESKEVVMVNDSAPLLQTDNANQTATFNAKQFNDLPVAGGDITTIAFTVPGIVVSTGAGYGNFSSHGLPGTSNLFTSDGNDNMDPYFNINNSGASNLTLGANEIAEVSVVQNGYSGQYGRQAGAQVNYLTKSGTNAFHGNLLYNYNDALFNANDFFANASGTPRGKAVSNQYGAAFGGPVKKDKTFFFVDTEGIRYVLPATGTVAIPTQPFQSFVLGSLPAAQVPLYQKAFGLYNSAPGVGRAVPVTTGGGALQDSTGNLGCGSFAGTPTGTGGTFGVDTPCANAFGTNVSNVNTEWLLTARVDQNITDKQKIFFHFKTDHGLQATGTDPINSAFNEDSSQPDYEGQMNYNYAITPSLVNNFIGAASWASALFGPTSITTTQSTLPTAFYFVDGGANGANSSAGGFTRLGLATNMPQGRRTGQLELIDDLSWIKGNHSLKFGGNYRYNRVTDSINGELSYVSEYYFASTADFAAGALDPTTGSFYRQRSATSLVNHLRFNTVGFYGEDEWAVKPNLKITATMRFDRTASPSCVDRCFSELITPFPSLDKGTNIPYNQSIQTGLKNAFRQTETLVPEPRLALVWSPGEARKTVIRTGFGIFTDAFPGSFLPSVFQNSPNSFLPRVRIGTVNTAGDPSSAAAINVATAAAFRQGFSAGYTLPQIRAALAPVAFTAPGYFSIPNQLVNPKYAEWNFEVQQQLSSKDVLTLSYVGNHGYDLFVENGMANANAAGGFANLPIAKPDPRFNQVTHVSNGAVSSYNGFTANYRRSLAAGFTGELSYTWSHALDEVSNGGLGLIYGNDSLLRQLDPYNLKALNYSNADYDIRHNITADFSWDVPTGFHNKLYKNIFGNWTLASKIFARTGTPFSVYDSTLGGALSPTLSGQDIMATLLDPHIRTSCTSVNTQCFDYPQFVASGSQTGFGNVPRNSFRAPGYFDIDTTLYKRITIREGMAVEFGATAYNLLNHPNFASPGQDLAAPGLGSISSTVSPPSSAYGSFQGSSVSGRVLVVTGRFNF